MERVRSIRGREDSRTQAYVRNSSQHASVIAFSPSAFVSAYVCSRTRGAKARNHAYELMRKGDLSA
eukprot:5654938-Pleurochrysis_carterae.AAC.2